MTKELYAPHGAIRIYLKDEMWESDVIELIKRAKMGKSDMAIVKSIIDGNHNPTELAMLAEDNCKATKEEIAKSLEGT